MGEHRRSGVSPLERIERPRDDASPRREKIAHDAAGRRTYDADPLCLAAPHEFGYFRPEDAVGNLAGKLPHWRQEGVTYFVTFRLADSLPQTKLHEWLRERDEWIVAHPQPWDMNTSSEYHRQFTARIEKWLDAGYGSCVLARHETRSVVADALRHFDSDRYWLDAWVVMPNHVHVVVTPLRDNGLSATLHAWKSFTSHAIGKLLPDWHGPFWQKESFDHIVRGPDHLERFRIYIANNPRGLARDTFALSCSAKGVK